MMAPVLWRSATGCGSSGRAPIGKRQAVDWNTDKDTPNGFELSWKVPWDFAAAYRWIWGYLLYEVLP